MCVCVCVCVCVCHGFVVSTHQLSTSWTDGMASSCMCACVYVLQFQHPKPAACASLSFRLWVSCKWPTGGDETPTLDPKKVLWEEPLSQVCGCLQISFLLLIWTPNELGQKIVVITSVMVRKTRNACQGKHHRGRRGGV